MDKKLKAVLQKHKKTLIFSILFLLMFLLCLLYCTSYIVILVKTGEAVLNPLLFPSYFHKIAFPKNFFWIFAGIGFLLVVCITVSTGRDMDRMDTERNFQYSKSGVYGTAGLLKEEDMQDVAQAQPINEAMGAILGQFDMTGERVVNMKDKIRINKHTCIFGASQSGKTWCYVIPFALQAARRRESLIVTDPKGELYETTAEYFRSLGYVVRRFDLKQPELSDGWDCLKEVYGSSESTPENRATIFSDIVIQNTAQPGAAQGGIYDDGPKLLLKALLLRAALDPDLAAKGERNIGTCVDYIKNERGAAYIDEEVFAAENVPYEARSCINTYNSFKQASPNLYGNLVTGLNARLQVFDSQTVKDIMSTDDIDLTLPGKKPCVYYCIMSDMHSALNFLGALFFSFLFLDLVEYADSLPEKRCPVPVNFLMDEFANIGSVPDFDKKMAVIRSRALNVSIILQDLNQLQNRYPKTYKSILSNCATHLCIGFNDQETQDYYTKRTGEATVKVRTDQHQAMETIFTIGHKHSTGDGRRSVLSSDELARMDKDECLVVWQGHNALKLKKFPADQHPEYKLLKRCRIKDYPPISDREAREELRRNEDAYIAQYEKWLAAGGNPFPHVKKESEEKKEEKSVGLICCLIDSIKKKETLNPGKDVSSMSEEDINELISAFWDQSEGDEDDVIDLDSIDSQTVYIERESVLKDGQKLTQEFLKPSQNSHPSRNLAELQKETDKEQSTDPVVEVSKAVHNEEPSQKPESSVVDLASYITDEKKQGKRAKRKKYRNGATVDAESVMQSIQEDSSHTAETSNMENEFDFGIDESSMGNEVTISFD